MFDPTPLTRPKPWRMAIQAHRSGVSGRACWRRWALGCWLAMAAAASTAAAQTPISEELQVGDVVFHTSLSGQSQAVQAATRSPWSHMGLVLRKDGTLHVFEAVEPVRYTPLQQWLDRGAGGRYVVKRLITPLTPAQQARLAQHAPAHEGKSYDLTFEWSDARIYCSELVWKLYHTALNLQLAPLARLGSFDLSHPAVRIKLQERYGSRIPLDEPVVSPQAIFDSPLLRTVAKR